MEPIISLKDHSPMPECQICSVKTISEGNAVGQVVSLKKDLRATVRGLIGRNNVRKLRIYLERFLNWVENLPGLMRKSASPTAAAISPSQRLQEGDWVRVRPKVEIEKTLNRWKQLRGCIFTTEMGNYCETNQRVYKVVRQFIDERDLKVHKATRLVLLDGIICHGVGSIGACDRSCFFFWREEWLEKLESNPREPQPNPNRLPSEEIGPPP